MSFYFNVDIFYLFFFNILLSSFLGRENCNDYSIGIELEGSDDSKFEDQQYHSLLTLIRLLIKTYPNLTKEKLVGHSDISPGRKTDPGPMFEWGKLKDNL